MYLFFRLIKVGLLSPLKKKLGILETCELSFITWPTDLDVFFHMNNGRYLAILDLCRFDALVRCKIAAILKEKKWYPVVAAETIEFKKSLKLFDQFKVKTNLLGWDEKYFYIQHVFISHHKIYAKAVIKGRVLRKQGGTVSPAEIFQAAEYPHPSPKVPQWILEWSKAQKEYALPK